MTPALRAHFNDYAAFHGTPGNKACHYIGIPLIVLTLFTFLSSVPLFAVGGYTVTLAEVLLLLVTVYYLTLDPLLAVMMALVSAGLIVLSRQIPMPIAIALFLLGWIFQAIGHYVYEKKSPAFFKNAEHLLVGPLWILAKATGRG